MLADFFNEIYLTTQILSYNLPLDYENHLIKMYLMGFPDSSVGKESTCNARDPGLIPGLGRSTGERKKIPTPVFWPGELHGLYSPWGSQRVGQD